MSIQVHVRKLLWGRAGNQCAWPNCDQSLIVDLGDPESSVLAGSGAPIGEEAHIRSGQTSGPRFDEDYPKEKIDSYENLILLCPTHHTIVDKNGGAHWSVAALEKVKSDHERAMDSTRTATQRRQQEIEERTAASITLWEQRVGIEEWDALTWGLNYAIPMISEKRVEMLLAAGRWLLVKSWPNEYPKIAVAFDQQRKVLASLVKLIDESMENEKRSTRYELIRDYKRIGWDPPLYEQLMHKFKVECVVAWWLTNELTRTTNLIITAVRQELDPLYRWDEGVVLQGEGDGILSNTLVRIEYSHPFDWENPPRIPGLVELRKRIQQFAPSYHDDPLDVDLSDITFDNVGTDAQSQQPADSANDASAH